MTEPVTLDYRLDLALMTEAADATARQLRPPQRPAWQRGLLLLAAMAAAGAVGAAFAEPLAGWSGEITAFGLGMLVGMAALWQAQAAGIRRVAARRLAAVMGEGRVRSRLDATGWSYETAGGRGWVPWAGITDVLDLRGALAVVAGTTAHPFPDAALPAGLDRASLAARIAAWRQAAATAEKGGA